MTRPKPIGHESPLLDWEPHLARSSDPDTSHEAGGVVELPKQCPTCGRCGFEDIETKISKDGGKARQTTLSGTTDEYTAWHRSLKRWCYAGDVDQIEWRKVAGELKPVAVLELTRVRGPGPVPSSYLRHIHSRFFRDSQAERTVHVADRLGCDAYVVLFRPDLTDFWAYNLTRDEQICWKHYSRAGFADWIERGLEAEWKDRR